MSDTPIEEYGLLSDRHGAALVSREGSVDWLCLPRFDSPALFARLLDDSAGHWLVRPEHTLHTARRYLPGTMVLRTEFTTETGTVELTDALALGASGDPHRLGEGAEHLLIRSVRCTKGSAEVRVEYRPRPEYGRVVPVLRAFDGGLRARGGPAALALSSPVALDTGDGAAGTVLALSEGETVRLALHAGSLDGPLPRLLGQREIGERLAATATAWRSWSRLHQDYQGPWRREVLDSGRVLQALSYQPTGAIVAAATTSLPEEVGGVRNWDYRYSWVRDAALSMDALGSSACLDEVAHFFAFMTDAAATDWPRTHLQIMYGIGGERDLTERELPHLAGWRGSVPVRVGNAAWTQAQLDSYGELLACAERFADRLDPDDAAQHAFLVSLADTAAEEWRTPDHGIWEVRGPAQHFVHSKLMCWVALDRALRLADRIGARHRVEGWKRDREEIREAILEHGWNTRTGAFTQYFGSEDLDASTLMLPISGFLPPTDERALATIDAVAAHLTDAGSGLVRRYRSAAPVDGLEGSEGSFLLCTFWLAQAQALAGRLEEARTVFERAASYANDLGLLAEQVDAGTGSLLGNYPQAFSHIGLINAAHAIGQAEGTLSRPLRGPCA
ncbi:glycoside hydrolase family 15 protein [Streptomyces xiaopingdaonensis]|uniref:glycoside hydrolase family 15 protein n=1 Tax=Streptomyces xiaopingdaonensis TaxID=1565415 RepID=UPI00030F09C3|nr:glycoside hydrolase family 15 protein [Streptomyces xiaopingdaonensis]